VKITYRLHDSEGLPGRVVCVREADALSADLRYERDRRTTFDGRWHVFADGVRFEDFRAALQAAWLASDYTLAADLARRHGFYNSICLRCASALIGAIPPTPNYTVNEWIFYQLCMRCWADALRDYSSMRTGAPTAT